MNEKLKEKRMRINKGQKYQIITDSPTFRAKYGKEQLFIHIEDRDKVVFGDYWWNKGFVPAIVAFVIRQKNDGMKNIMGHKAYYGKVFSESRHIGIGELVFDYELKPLK